MADSNYGPENFGRDALLILGGALIGAAVALLYAPQSGDRTRRQIARKLEDARTQAKDYSDELLDRVDDLKKQVSRQLDAGVSTVSERVSEKKEALMDNIASLETKIGSLKKKLVRR